MSEMTSSAFCCPYKAMSRYQAGEPAMPKYYVWGFPGIGKSSVDSGLQIIDADCECFKFLRPPGVSRSPHSQEYMTRVQRDPVYPQNYLDYVRSVSADMVLLNCHISLLEALDKDKLLLVYPAPALKEEYLQRYARRGDSGSYLHYMETAFDEIIAAARDSPYRKYEITDPHIYLQNLIEKGTIMDQFITKQELSTLLAECIHLEVYTPEGPAAGKTPEELAQMLFEGHLSLDIGSLRNELSAKKAVLEQEHLLQDRRGGLSHEQLKQKIMEGIVNGALSIRHDQIAPYSYGYEVGFRSPKRGINYRWECYCTLPNVAEQITCSIEKAMPPVDISAFLEKIASAEQDKITSFVPERSSGLEPRGRYTGHVANAQDVHQGIALDGIIQGHFRGDYNSMTTAAQNDAVCALVALKGFCLDYVHELHSRPMFEFVIGYLKDHGTDISTPEKLNAWIRANPDRCALPENREQISPSREPGPTASTMQKRKNQRER